MRHSPLYQPASAGRWSRHPRRKAADARESAIKTNRLLHPTYFGRASAKARRCPRLSRPRSCSTAGRPARPARTATWRCPGRRRTAPCGRHARPARTTPPTAHAPPAPAMGPATTTRWTRRWRAAARSGGSGGDARTPTRAAPDKTRPPHRLRAEAHAHPHRRRP